jgi:periplasmic protein TonB
MKKISLVIILFITQLITAQEQKKDSIISPEIIVDQEAVFPFDKVDVPPSPPGGEEQFYDFLKKNMKQPNVPALVGKVFISFTVEKDGSLTDFSVLKDIGFGCGEEAIRVLEKSPKWRPGKVKGNKVRVSYILPIVISTN